MMNNKIFYIDDDENIRFIWSETLQKIGFEVIACENGQIALDRLSQCLQPPLLIISDLHMPIMSGIAFIRQASALPQLKSVPFILCSSDYRAESIGKQLGLAAVISKMPTGEVLAKVLSLTKNYAPSKYNR